MRRRVVGMLVGFSLLLVLASAGAAAGVWYSYNLTVPRFGGEAYTNNARKLYTGYASVWATSVGGDYTLKVWLERYDGTDLSCTSCYRISDNTRILISNTSYPTDLVHVTFKTDYTTPVSVLTYGLWSPDSP